MKIIAFTLLAIFAGLKGYDVLASSADNSAVAHNIKIHQERLAAIGE